MAIVVENSTVDEWTVETNSRTISNFTVASGSNRLLVVAIGSRGSGAGADANVTNVTWNGTALTERENRGNANRHADIWTLTAPEAGTFNIVITFGGDGAASASVGVYSLQGVDQITPINANNGAAATATDRGSFSTLSATLTTTVANCLLITSGGYDQGGFTSSAYEGIDTVDNVTATSCGVGRTTIASATSHTFGWRWEDSTSELAAVAGIAVNPATAAVRLSRLPLLGVS